MSIIFCHIPLINQIFLLSQLRLPFLTIVGTERFKQRMAATQPPQGISLALLSTSGCGMGNIIKIKNVLITYYAICNEKRFTLIAGYLGAGTTEQLYQQNYTQLRFMLQARINAGFYGKK